MDIILSGAQSITLLVQDILDLEAIEAGTFPLSLERMDVRTTVRGLERKARRGAVRRVPQQGVAAMNAVPCAQGNSRFCSSKTGEEETQH